MITLENISFGYSGNLLFQNLDFEIEKNTFIGLIGNNGSGKTTLLKLILGIEKPTLGELKNIINRKNDIHFFGGLIEHPPLFEYMTVYENLEYKKILLGLHNDAIEEAIDSCQLREFYSFKVRNLSLGNKQKLGIALAIINKPKILVLDEPTNSIDVNTAADIMKLLVNYQKKSETTIILISHDQKIINDYCQKVYKIIDHKILKVNE